jgi:hypothetical protein
LEAAHLFEYDEPQSCYRYAKKYESSYRGNIEDIVTRNGPAIQKCEACSVKGDETGDML